MRQLPRRIVLSLAVGSLGGCEYHAPAGGPTTVTVVTPLTIPPPPPGALPPPSIGSRDPTRPVDGEYTGVAKAIFNPHQNCTDAIKVTHWLVDGNQVSYRGFRGTIAPDGGRSGAGAHVREPATPVR